MLIALMTACTDEPAKEPPFSWRDNQPVHVFTEPTLPSASSQAFHRRARTDINRWRDGLMAVGCPAPFHYVPDVSDELPNSMRLVPTENWDRTDGAIGVWFDGIVFIRAEGDGTLDTYADDPTWIVGLHELGHAMGLGHAELIVGEPSIMTTYRMYPVDPSKPLPARDIRDAACLLECGPCPQ